MTRYTQADFDGGGAESMAVSQRVVRAVAAELDADPLEMDRLYEAIDPEGLNALFEPTKRGLERATGTVTFRYANCTVTVRADGDVEVVAEDARGSASRTDLTTAN
ncbi:HalOD1 output domain-containing protein [Natronococcus wangiae]|uniref:HalOD1 output domain-containing protein n=1 Tax=Natronococcus wangiae TaxID=3068275 RepID=UPI0027402956|nr:HalOD1 output domain-containing protein [Natronococcus sp. AD5]